MLSRFIIPLCMAIMAAGGWKAYFAINPSEDWGAAAAVFTFASTLSVVAPLILILLLLPLGKELRPKSRRSASRV